jgi:hypothetical protein
MSITFYTEGGYLKEHPTWLVEDSPWKARQVMKMIDKHQLSAKKVCEVGCGAGEILNQLYSEMADDVQFTGYELSPQAYDLCLSRSKDRLSFKLQDLLHDPTDFDLLLCLDVFEHVDDYFTFLTNLRSKATYKIFHIPLDLSVSTVLRGNILEKSWMSSGHIHFFTKEIALKALIKSGYRIVDHFYTPYYADCCAKSSWKGKIMRIPRQLSYAVNPDLAVRILGGYELLVLAM